MKPLLAAALALILASVAGAELTPNPSLKSRRALGKDHGLGPNRARRLAPAGGEDVRGREEALDEWPGSDDAPRGRGRGRDSDDDSDE